MESSTIQPWTIAVVGCLHGDVDKMYTDLRSWEVANEVKIDVVLCCGDFQAVRDQKDLEAMSCPPKYREMGSFHLYHSQKKVAPFLTIFIGGNHEASNHMRDLYFGGWVAKNIYYVGNSGVLDIVKNGQTLTIGGLSGI